MMQRPGARAGGPLVRHLWEDKQSREAPELLDQNYVPRPIPERLPNAPRKENILGLFTPI